MELLSGVYEGKTLGTPIAALVRNADAARQDYATARRQADRPGHADRVWRERFQHRDPRGGGRTSGRETLSRVIGGAVAEALLARELPELRTVAWVGAGGAADRRACRRGCPRAPRWTRTRRAAPTRGAADAHGGAHRARQGRATAYGGAIERARRRDCRWAWASRSSAS